MSTLITGLFFKENKISTHILSKDERDREENIVIPIELNNAFVTYVIRKSPMYDSHELKQILAINSPEEYSVRQMVADKVLLSSGVTDFDIIIANKVNKLSNLHMSSNTIRNKGFVKKHDFIYRGSNKTILTLGTEENTVSNILKTSDSLRLIEDCYSFNATISLLSETVGLREDPIPIIDKMSPTI